MYTLNSYNSFKLHVLHLQSKDIQTILIALKLIIYFQSDETFTNMSRYFEGTEVVTSSIPLVIQADTIKKPGLIPTSVFVYI